VAGSQGMACVQNVRACCDLCVGWVVLAEAMTYLQTVL